MYIVSFFFFCFQFAVVSFSSTAEVLGSTLRPCVNLFMLSQATPINIKLFEQEINGLSANGATNYEAALDKAFNFFQETNFGVTGEKRGRSSKLYCLT